MFQQSYFRYHSFQGCLDSLLSLSSFQGASTAAIISRKLARIELLTSAWRRPTLPGPCGPSTIGAGGLNGRVRVWERVVPLRHRHQTDSY